MIVIQDLRKRFGAVDAVRGVSFQRRGRQGHRPARPERRRQDDDAADAVGADAARCGPHHGRRRRMSSPIRSGRSGTWGCCPTRAVCIRGMTAREHIRYFGELHGMTAGRLTRSHRRSLMTRLGLEPVADRRVAGFSQGERTKVALARALVHAPRNVILDEPTNGLDVMSTRAMRALIRGLREDGCCVVFSSHIMQEVSALCDRIVVIAHGTVVAEGTAGRTATPDGHGRSRGCVRHAGRTRSRGAGMTPWRRGCGRVPKGAAWTAARDRRSMMTLVFSAVIAPVLFGVIFTVAAERGRMPRASRCRSPARNTRPCSWTG